MKTINRWSTLLGLGIFAATAAFIATPASAAVNCPKYPIPLQTSYPLNGHIYNCMPTPRNSAETQLQAQILNSVNAGVSKFFNKRTNDLNARNIDIVVAYTGADAFAKESFTPVPPEKQIGDNESGRSFVFPNQTAVLTNPTSNIFVFTKNQWNAIPGNPKIPTSYSGAQVTGTTAHELGHQMDRIWAQKLGYSPAASAVVTGTVASHFGAAVNIDGAQLTQTDIDTISNNYPRLLVDPPPAAPVLNFNELFAEMIAIQAGGGVRQPEDDFIKAKFRCSLWVVTSMWNNDANNNTPPANPTSGLCNGRTTW